MRYITWTAQQGYTHLGEMWRLNTLKAKYTGVGYTAEDAGRSKDFRWTNTHFRGEMTTD